MPISQNGQTNFLSVSDHFVGLVPKGLTFLFYFKFNLGLCYDFFHVEEHLIRWKRESKLKKRVIIRKFDSSIFDEIKLVFVKGARLFDKTIGDKNVVKMLGLSMQ